MWEIRNNIVKHGVTTDGVIRGLYNALIENNILINTRTYSAVYHCSYCTLKNNVIISEDVNDDATCNTDNMYVRNNVLSSQSSIHDGNVLLGSSDLTKIFKCTGTAYSGEYYTLIEGSPAIGAGNGGIDCGVMAGAYRFVPYGRPRFIPVIKEVSVPTIPTDGKIKVSLKIENQNE